MLNKVQVITVIVLAVLMIFGMGCSEPASVPTETSVYLNEAISFSYPEWRDVQPEQEEIFILKTDGSSVFAAAKYPTTVPLIKQEMEHNLKAVFEGDYASYELSGLNSKTRLLYCGYDTYAISMMSPAEPDISYLSSAECRQGNSSSLPRLGLIPLPANDDSSLIVPAIKESREIGAEILSWYLFWADLNDGWSIIDQLLPPLSYEGKTAVLLNIIYTNQLGDFPEKFKHFTDAGFKEEFAEFSIEFIDRYHPDYYLIGGEVDIYLAQHRDEIDDYREFYSYVRDEIKKVHPETRLGIVFTYHSAKQSDAFDIIRTLGSECDVIVYTVHAFEDDFNYSDVSRGLQYLEEAAALIPDKPYAIIETGWSSSPLLGSSEDKQAEFVCDFFDFIETSEAEFVLWFGLHEWSDCSEAAERFIGDIEVSQDYRKRFEEFMCSLGLKYYDGTPKKAYDAWRKELSE